MPLPSEIRARLAEIAADRLSGATALVLRGIALMLETSHDQALMRETAIELCRSQPSMAGFRTTCAVALAAADPRREMMSLDEGIRRAPSIIAGIAASRIRWRHPLTDPLRIVTCSRSATTEQTALALARLGGVRVSCAESRPLREGAALALALYHAGVEVILYSDAGIGGALADADALMVGADAVSESGFINKVGTASLAALARSCDVPVFVLAGREKVVPQAVYSELPIVEGPRHEVAGELPDSSVRNPSFERVSAELVTLFITDGGAVEPDQSALTSLWTEEALGKYMSVINAYNMLDNN